MSAEAASMLGTESTSTSEHSQFENIINSFEGALSFVRKRRTELLLTGVTMLGGIAYNAADADAAPADVYASASAMAYKKDLSLFSPSSRNSSRVISREILASTSESSNTEQQRKKEASLYKKCAYSVNLVPGRPGGKGRRNNKKRISGKVEPFEGGKDKFIYYLKNAKYCGMLIVRNDYTMSFPKPTKMKKSTGYYKDKIGNGIKGVQAIVFFAKPIGTK